MPLKRLLISAAAVLGLSALGLSADAAAPTASGAGHDQIAGNGKSTFTLIFRGGGFRGGGFRGGGFGGGGFRGGGFRGGGFRGGAIGYRGGFGRSYAFAGRGRWGGAGWGVRRAGWGGGWGRRRLGRRLGRAACRLGRRLGPSRLGRRLGRAACRLGRRLGPSRLGRRLGLAACRLGWRLGPSRMGLASRRLGRWRLGLACWRRACRLGVRRRRKLLLELSRGWLWTWLLQRKLILLLRLGLLAPIETCSLQRDDPGCPGAGVFHAIVEEPGARDKMNSFLTAEWRSGQQLLQLFTTGCVCRSLTYLGAALKSTGAISSCIEAQN